MSNHILMDSTEKSVSPIMRRPETQLLERSSPMKIKKRSTLGPNMNNSKSTLDHYQDPYTSSFLEVSETLK
jgi:hypothetical protein